MHAATRNVLTRGAVMPVSPLTLGDERRLDEWRQRGVVQYYLAAGAGHLPVARTPRSLPSAIRNVGLFGQWAEWTHAAVELLERRHAARHMTTPQ